MLDVATGPPELAAERGAQEDDEAEPATGDSRAPRGSGACGRLLIVSLLCRLSSCAKVTLAAFYVVFRLKAVCLQEVASFLLSHLLQRICFLL